ncbi:MAG: HEAT repeat domain-containing protein, partial [Candidatus Aminicenantales bacterium]
MRMKQMPRKKKQSSGFWKKAVVLGVMLPVLTLVLKAGQAEEPLRALIIAGKGTPEEHTAPPLEVILEETGLFEVETVLCPVNPGENPRFRPDFSSYRVVVLHLRRGSWSPEVQQAFEAYVRSGGGVVVTPPSGWAFPEWKTYTRIIGLGGDRGEADGPYVFWKRGRLHQEAGPGLSGRASEPHPYAVYTRNRSHPITRGLPEKWMHAEDKLVGLLRGPAKGPEVLATAPSDPAYLGTGREEPVLLARFYGKGRVFHTELGHAEGNASSAALECVGFIVTLQRGAEWAATGDVTQNVPGDFPAVLRASSTPDDIRLWKGCCPPNLDEILEGVRNYDYGKDREVLSRLRDYVRSVRNSPDARKACEGRLAAFLTSDLSPAARMAVCRHLREIGTSVSVPALEKMLLVAESSDAARYALEKIPGLAAEQALIRALSQTRGKVRVGIVASLGNRGAATAVPALARVLREGDDAEARAAARALGQIAGPRAADVLFESLSFVSERLRDEVAAALIRCAETAAAERDLQQASRLYERVIGMSLPLPLRQAARKGRIACAGEGAREMILEALRSPEMDGHAPAIAMVASVFRGSEIAEVCTLLPRLAPEHQVQLLGVLSRFPRRETLEAAVQAASSAEGDVRVAALGALKALGGPSVVRLLARKAAEAHGREQQAARDSLSGLGGADVDEEIIVNLAREKDPKVQAELVRSLGERSVHAGLSWVLEKARSAETQVRRQAWQTLKDLALPEDLPRLVALLLDIEEEDQNLAAGVVAAVAAKGPTRPGRAEPVLQA